jgi:hypothetical protein
MSKKFENLDSIVLGEQPMELELNETVTEVDSKSTESVKELENSKKEVEKDGLIDLDFVEPKDEEIEEEIPTKEEKETLEEVKEEITPVDQTEVLKHWANHFKESSILNDDDLTDFDGTIEGLSKSFEKREVRVGLEMVEDYKSQLPNVLKYLAENWEEGVPLNDLLNIKSNQIKYSNITDDKLEESIDTQKAIYAEYLKKTTKYSDSKIEKEVNRLADLDELKDEAKESLVELKKFEAEAEENIRKETKKEQERRKEENYKEIKTYEKASKELKEVIPGIKLTDKEQKEIFDKTINPVGIDGHGNSVSYLQTLRNENPYEFDLKLNYIMNITKGLKDFSKITNSVTTKATKDLSNILNSPIPKSGKDNISTAEKKSLIDYLSLPQNKINKK